LWLRPTRMPVYCAPLNIFGLLYDAATEPVVLRAGMPMTIRFDLASPFLPGFVLNAFIFCLY
jgi:hypothetical protein